MAEFAAHKLVKYVYYSLTIILNLLQALLITKTYDIAANKYKTEKKRNQFSCKVQIMNKTIATLFVIFFFSQGCLGKGFTPMEIDNHPCTPENLKVHCPIHWIVQRLNY